jgi:hypothetical protein
MDAGGQALPGRAAPSMRMTPERSPKTRLNGPYSSM